ncbi:MAG: ATP-binding cassette domain-containing protein [Provencibacterium sp.]|nr:ATP-binding cassette domain-containing protein [Provencibacterium sp.]
MIEMTDIRKTFRVSRRSGGMKAALGALFHREYELIRALDGVSFKIQDGEMVGYIGPNGAGKSSSIKIMSGILTPDSGECLIDGRIPWKQRQEHVKKIGVVFGQRSQLWWDVPVVDSFELIRDIYEIEEPLYQKNLARLTEQLDLQEILRTPTRQLSLGQRMRCEIAASLLHSPKILFLDEPTIGLDAVSKIAVREFIRRLNREEGTTVLLTTHDMQDIEALTERIILIGRGRILSDGPLSALRERRDSRRTLTLLFSGTLPAPCPGLKILEQQGGRAVLEADTGILPVSAAISWLSERVEINDLSIGSQSIENLVADLYREYAI